MRDVAGRMIRLALAMRDKGKVATIPNYGPDAVALARSIDPLVILSFFDGWMRVHVQRWRDTADTPVRQWAA